MLYVIKEEINDFIIIILTKFVKSVSKSNFRCVCDSLVDIIKMQYKDSKSGRCGLRNKI